MCGRFLLKVTRLERLEQVLAGQFDAPLPPLRPRFNIAPSQDVAIVRRSLSGTCELSWVRWGLVPSWSEEPRTPYSTINARAETVDTKPAFRSAFRHRRCLIPADGWYEWERKEKRKLPWVFHRKDGGDFAFAGLWEHWARGDQVLESCSIIVTAANRVAAAVHDRMPVILPPERYADWLDPNRDPASLKSLLVPCPDEWLASHRVGLAVNSAANDFPSVVAPVEA
jgi:putative SOS response-associated peptidase YedK